MPRGNGTGSIFKRGRIWWCRVYVENHPVDESSKSSDYEGAKRHLAEMNGRKARGELGGRNAKLTINLLLDHFLKVLPSRVTEETLAIQKLVINAHLRPYFGRIKAEKLTTNHLLAYRADRAKEKTNKGTPTKPATINRELSILRNAMRTAAFSTPPMLPLSAVPRFPIVNEDEFARQGFITDDHFDRVIAELPAYLVPITTVSYNTGIRKGELLKINWDQVDFEAKLIRLYSGRTKGRKPRIVPMMGTMEQALLEAKRERDEKWPGCHAVFARLGERLGKDFRGAWDAACERAGVAGLEFHDLRRSGVRNMSRSGTPERVIMAITGHRTRAMFDRYNIVAESDFVDAATRMNSYREAQKAAQAKLNSDKKRDSAPETPTAIGVSDGR